MSNDESGPGRNEHLAHGPLAPATGAATGPLMSSGGTGDPHWYKHAVFYEVLARGFFDSNGDGTGDLTGLVRKLDYLQWLGVDCVWLLPMYESPLRDGGYDISDYFKVLPEFGTTADFVELLDEAHRRGIRVITDLVMNHTSDQHPWFKASREDPDGPYGDFYVWSDTDERYEDARIIFVDTETSNWTYDEVRGQYYWHRFFSHQPDLNFENPAVQEAILEVLRYWLDLGIDGFRLDAVPYLYEREGTNCENLKETHEFLKRVRAEVDRLYPGRVLLSEANQWPSDVVDYFGDHESGGDECHMNFHFPLMPRMFMAVRQEQRFPISEILAQTPEIPRNCQWAIFLRNHDELTLEMVTDEERDYMYSEYAKDPRMRANVGIRRRLAPLLDNDRDQIELFTALLLSLPGSPVLYYGDEIGMGDNIWLGDRDAVRTPMQWSSDRNAGFSTGDPGRLYLPLILDPVYGYQAVNVEAQRANPGSLLHWTRRMIQIRKRHPVFGTGAFTELNATNPSVLAFIREHGDDRMLCVNNLSKYPQPVELDLSRYAGVNPVECVGGVRFPAIGELPYLLTLPGHGFYWFQLPTAGADPEPAVAREEDTAPSYGLPAAGVSARTALSGRVGHTRDAHHTMVTTPPAAPTGEPLRPGGSPPPRGSAVTAPGPTIPMAEGTGPGVGEKGNRSD
ncbi:maltose alpha-D-glucosyltransferase [Nocardiopsis lambiniae]|uniref:maltose alpha-D-glucosyltransferase n=1 Tax=Nocardiopsis lambiniae TaxID=3075539 RepID=A0ABU2M576_9ACTN|nr:maltose alpha-D-glucosyltransferase [Nocardiopsis sp. DSM 44743]MDT0327782.1 maltose alpha-D-glucosyltransferase [Nocardiopsis sp. DSM 44743]